MKAEKLIAKGVEKKFDGQQLWFSVESLNEHYKGVKYHESDLDESGFIKASDIFGDDIQEIEVEPIEVDETLDLSVDTDFTTYEKDNSDLEVLEPTIEAEATAETIELNPEFVEAGIKVGEIITVDAVEPITEVAKTILESRILKADYVEQTEPKAEQIIQGIAPDGVSIDLETIEEIIPAKVVKTKADKK